MSDSAAPAERWRDVPGHEGLYAVSDLGRIWSSYGAGRYLALVVQRMPTGYLRKRVVLCKNGVKTQMSVHQVVMLAFGPPQPPGQEVRHLNGNSLDCRYANLEWGSHRKNAQDMIDHGRANGPGDGSAHPRAKLTEAIAIEARNDYATGQFTERALAVRHGVNVSTMHRLLKRQTWDHV